MSLVIPGTAPVAASTAIHTVSIKALTLSAAGMSSSWRQPGMTTRIQGDIAGQPLQDIFGNYAAYVTGTLLIVVTILIIWAFQRGQPIELGPVKIGRLRRRTSRKETGIGQHVLPAPNPEDVTRIYDVSNAAQFYGVIAVNYDQGNSVNLLATHMEVIAVVSRVRETKPGARILDLGGGTGHAVATHFFNDTSIRWTYVDFSPAMVGQLQQHLAGRPLYENLQVYVEDINQVHRRLHAKHYDIVLLNLVCSSMPQLPSFARLAQLMSPDGLLIVSDINPQYTYAHPYFKGTTADGAKVALSTRAVEPLDVLARTREAGLQLAEMKKISDVELSYSFIAVFANTVHPGGNHQGQAGHLLPPESVRTSPPIT